MKSSIDSKLRYTDTPDNVNIIIYPLGRQENALKEKESLQL